MLELYKVVYKLIDYYNSFCYYKKSIEIIKTTTIIIFKLKLKELLILIEF